MIKPQTYLNIADNTGAQKIMCIRILGPNCQYANIGDIIIAVVKLCIRVNNLYIFLCFYYFIILLY
jgi:ribosomal protein L14